MDLNERIESNCKGDFLVKIDGAAPGQKVAYELDRLEFQLGTYANRSRLQLTADDENGRQYRDKIERYFNTVTIPVFWHLTEPRRGQYDFEPYLEMCRWARQHQKRMLGHSLLYGWDGLDDCDPDDEELNFIQPWVRDLDRDGLEQALRESLRRSLDRFGPYIDDFVLNNEVLGKYGTDPHDWFSKRLGAGSLEPYFRWAREASPSARFYVNENSILAGENTGMYCELIAALLDAGTPVGGIGIQGHFFGSRVPPAEQMWEKLEALSQFDLPIRVTEFGVRSVDPHHHAEDVRRLLEVCFAHPAVAGVHSGISGSRTCGRGHRKFAKPTCGMPIGRARRAATRLSNWSRGPGQAKARPKWTPTGRFVSADSTVTTSFRWTAGNITSLSDRGRSRHLSSPNTTTNRPESESPDRVGPAALRPPAPVPPRLPEPPRWTLLGRDAAPAVIPPTSGKDIPRFRYASGAGRVQYRIDRPRAKPSKVIWDTEGAPAPACLPQVGRLPVRQAGLRRPVR